MAHVYARPHHMLQTEEEVLILLRMILQRVLEKLHVRLIQKFDIDIARMYCWDQNKRFLNKMCVLKSTSSELQPLRGVISPFCGHFWWMMSTGHSYTVGAEVLAYADDLVILVKGNEWEINNSLQDTLDAHMDPLSGGPKAFNGLPEPNSLLRLQRLASLAITGALRTTPSAAMEILLDLPPLHIFMEREARWATYRLHQASSSMLQATTMEQNRLIDDIKSHSILSMPSDIVAGTQMDQKLQREQELEYTVAALGHLNILWNCQKALNNLSLRNHVTLVWIPGHSGQEGNEIADSLARKEGETTFIGPEPVLGISYNTAKMAVLNWSERRNPSVLAELTRLYTGHCRNLDIIMHRIGLVEDTECRLCLEDDTYKGRSGGASAEGALIILLKFILFMVWLMVTPLKPKDYIELGFLTIDSPIIALENLHENTQSRHIGTVQFNSMGRNCWRAKAAITRLETFVRNSENDSSIDVNEYIIREPFLVKAFEEYITVQNQIEDEDESQADDRIEVEQKYLSLSAKLKRSIQKLSAVPKIENGNSPNSRPRESTSNPLSKAMPKISLPTFSGKYDEWNAFIDLFTVLPANPLTEVREMLVTDDNYKTALDLLKKRYSNKLVIINSHLKALIETPNVTKGDASNLRRFLSHIKQHINSLKSLEVPVDTWDLMLIYLLSHKLDFRTHQSYELEKPSNDLPKLVDLIDFIEKRCTALENVTVPDTKYKPSRHTVAKCTSNGCKICGKKHHTLLHRNSKPTDDKSKETTAQTAFATNDNNSEQCRCSESRSHSPAECSAADQTTLFTHGEDSQILLGTANIILLSKSGVKVNVRALLDSASQTTFITLETFKRLNDDGYMKIINIQGISNNSTQTNKMVDVKILSRINNSFKINAHCAVLSKITWPLPHSVVDRQKLEIPADLNLADPLFHQPSKIDMLIGADILFDIIAPGIIRLGKDLPTMQNTQLGWIIAGPAPSKNSFSHISINLFSHQLPLEELIPKFWQIEEITTKRFLSPEDKLCERKFVDSLIRLKNGAFQVDLPLRNDNDYKKLGDSYTSAARRFINLEKRFLRDQNLFSEYKQFIDEYVKLGHASGASTVEEGVQLVSELNKMLNSAQFHLHKWNSNNTSILTGVTHSFRYSLDSQSDQFNFSVPSLPVDKVLTKRQVLSCIARMFDPLGLIGPIVVSAKILMQKIWCSKINWDERLPPNYKLFGINIRKTYQV
ncbi:hypothetical protein NQ317_010498 [Molorchus minor]|uniref:Peptidase aspartic putative domain-containing protein n=1 Tax=Molorchus minor TaxID=1323400 RepID=A0ABQ9IUZ8_9CUCU|nr:hypothetical protein NQ317_010498 [Molorchus minor]